LMLVIAEASGVLDNMRANSIGLPLSLSSTVMRCAFKNVEMKSRQKNVM
jgi:hypothetical protein